MEEIEPNPVAAAAEQVAEPEAEADESEGEKTEFDELSDSDIRDRIIGQEHLF